MAASELRGPVFSCRLWSGPINTQQLVSSVAPSSLVACGLAPSTRSS
ncbi:hypothetical protein RRG08_014673 [Elysia crispata]|uniref:Uncharacterized protein n=1 Tax=Elysia crispata TaxID=231223 RepID=A0AAE0YIK7_9GAST|nr:hypothetical protein RRG08_014673 [Elysia crispata]